MVTIPDITKNVGIKFVCLLCTLDFFSTMIPGVVINHIYLGQSGNTIGIATPSSIALICVTLFALSGAYQLADIGSPVRFIKLRIAILACLWAVILTIIVGLKHGGIISRVWLFSWATTTVLLYVVWAILFFYLKNSTKFLLALKPTMEIIFFQCDDSGPMQALARQKFSNYSLVNISRTEDITVLVQHIQLQRFRPKIMAIICKPEALEKILSSLYQFKLSGLEIFLSAVFFSGQNLGAKPILMPTYTAVQRPMEELDIFVKRLIDILLSAFLLLIAIPLIVIIAIFIYLEDGWPVIFRQTRVGYGNIHFEVLKFRTMHVKSGDLGAERQTTEDDDRVTRVGRILRATSLDELPQLFNVLRGTMSLVGPRPHALKMNIDYVPIATLIESYGRRHSVRPGITGLAQVRGFRGPVHDVSQLKLRIEADIEYIENWSIRRDVTILIKTVYLVLGDMFRLVIQRKAGWR